MIAAIVAGVLILFAYHLGLGRGFSRGYYAALFDLSIGEPEEYVEALAEDGDDSDLGKFAALIQAGREGRN